MKRCPSRLEAPRRQRPPLWELPALADAEQQGRSEAGGVQGVDGGGALGDEARRAVWLLGGGQPRVRQDEACEHEEEGDPNIATVRVTGPAIVEKVEHDHMDGAQHPWHVQ